MDDILLGRLAANASMGGYGTFDMLFISHISTFVHSFSFYLIISLKPCIFAYRSWANDKLDDLQYKRYTEKMKKAVKAVEVKSLSPTSAAARYHSLRVFYQICEWKGHASDLEPTEWGGKVVGQRFQPIT